MARQTRTIEATGKVWKAFQLVGGLLMVGSVAVGCTGFVGMGGEAAGGAVVGLSVLGLAVGLVLFLVGRVGGWWYHG